MIPASESVIKLQRRCTSIQNCRLARRTALATWRAKRAFDIVFMDMRMPEMDGIEATRAIRALGGRWRDIPIVALTANAFAEDIKACRDVGMNDFIAKPIRKPMLVKALATVLAGHPAVRAATNETATSFPAATLAPTTAAEVFATATPPTGALPLLDRSLFTELVEAIDADGARAALTVFEAETLVRLDALRQMSATEDRARIREEPMR